MSENTRTSTCYAAINRKGQKIIEFGSPDLMNDWFRRVLPDTLKKAKITTTVVIEELE